METIKLIIWDMDETFWNGTLSDGEVQPIQENIEIVKRLTDRGIVNSICSKNDFDKTKEKLVEMGIWDYFVFPSIDWTNKGIRVKNIISDMGLRPVNVLFLDDNINNLKEAQYECPALQVATPDKLAELIKDPAFDGKDDSSHSRLNQYKILEKKAEARQQSSSNEEFLYQSDIHVELIEDCSDKLQRIHEMIHRNNQLNFTKDRISREEVDNLFTDNSVRKGVVHVTDKYGDHGIIGCYAIKDNVAKQFVFSCRILGMGVEQWVYAELGYPEITVVGEVANQLNKTDKPAWINQTGKVNSATCTTGGGTATPRLIVYGTCPLRPVWGYLQPKLPNAKFAEIVPAPPICNLAVAFREDREYLDNLCKRVNVFDAVYTFDRDFVEGNTDYILISMQGATWMWKYVSKSCASYFYTSAVLEENSSDQEFITDYDCNRVTYEDIQNELSYLCNHLPLNTTLLIQTIPEVEFSVGKDADYENRIRLNKIAEDIANRYSNAKLIDIRKFAKTPADFFEELANHYNRAIGYKLAQEVLGIMGVNEIVITEVKNDIVPSNAYIATELAIGQTGDMLDFIAYIRNGIFRVQLKLINADKYDVKVEFWRNRYCEAIVKLGKSLTYDLSVNKVGYWVVKLIIVANANENEIYKFNSKAIAYDGVNYINYVDPKADNYDAFIDSVNQLQRDVYWKERAYKTICNMVSNLAASKVTIADYFTENNINDIIIVTNSDIGSLLIPYFCNSNVRIKYIISPDNITEISGAGSAVRYIVYSIDELMCGKITISSKDTIFYAINDDYELFWIKIFNKIPSKKLYLSYVLNWLYTKTFFTLKSKQIDTPRMVFVRCPLLVAYGGTFNFNSIKSEERYAYTFLKDDNNAFSKLGDEYDSFPAQYKKLSKEELMETLARPTFYRDNYGVQRMRDRSGSYFNIENGFRLTTGQPERYKGKVYIFGNSIAYGCGNKDSDTISSKLQLLVGDRYRVENRGNMYGRGNSVSTGHMEMVKLMENIKLSKNDVVIILSNNTCHVNHKGEFPMWEAIEKPIVKLDAYPIFEKQDRPDYFLLPEAYTAEGNQAIAELIVGKLKEIGYLK